MAGPNKYPQFGWGDVVVAFAASWKWLVIVPASVGAIVYFNGSQITPQATATADISFASAASEATMLSDAVLDGVLKTIPGPTASTKDNQSWLVGKFTWQRVNLGFARANDRLKYRLTVSDSDAERARNLSDALINSWANAEQARIKSQISQKKEQLEKIQTFLNGDPGSLKNLEYVSELYSAQLNYEAVLEKLEFERLNLRRDTAVTKTILFVNNARVLVQQTIAFIVASILFTASLLLAAAFRSFNKEYKPSAIGVTT